MEQWWRRASPKAVSTVAVVTGSRRLLPIDPRSAFHPNGSADAPAAIIPVAPPASATRAIAPRLPGSCTSAAATTSGTWPAKTRSSTGAGRAASATMPSAERTGLIASITLSDTMAISTWSRVNSVTSDATSRRSCAAGVTARCRMPTPALRASLTRCAPSSSTTSPSSPRAAARYRGTRGFFLLVTVTRARIALWYDCPVRMAPTIKDRLIKKFEDEIQTLNTELRLELPKEIKRARELGDLSENAEYQAAKERQRLVEARISMLQKRVSEIALINVDRIPRDRAGFGSTLHVVESNGEKLVFQLVMPEDADAGKGMISTTSPIGRAFLNKEEGDTINVTTPGGPREFEIVKLLTIHDEAAE